MKYLFSLMLLAACMLTANKLFGQAEKPAYKRIADKFESFYNEAKYDSIFAMFSPEMAKALPADQASEFLSGLRSQTGKITKRQFVKYEMTYASYKTNFDQAVFAVNISVDKNEQINGLFVKPFVESTLPIMQRNTTKMKLPFNGQWTIVWGGDTKELNYHVESQAQKNAFDILITDAKGSTHKNEGVFNDDYYAFGQEIIAPCDGEVIMAVDGVKDNKPGEMNPVYLTGNSVIIKTTNNEYLLFAHFKNHSVAVKEGQKIKQGTLLGHCGNSGNSSEPHLHFHIQNVENMNIATGVKCYFEKLMVNGKEQTDYSPIKNDRVENIH
ncbi:MAG: peptidoglycan DD-metalloendopeptidase family protein [Ferruginibacter sp.]